MRYQYVIRTGSGYQATLNSGKNMNLSAACFYAPFPTSVPNHSVFITTPKSRTLQGRVEGCVDGMGGQEGGGTWIGIILKSNKLKQQQKQTKTKKWGCSNKV